MSLLRENENLLENALIDREEGIEGELEEKVENEDNEETSNKENEEENIIVIEEINEGLTTSNGSVGRST